MAAFVSVKCNNLKCGKTFPARRADQRRGWAKFCSKSCKAVEQEKRTGQYSEMIHSQAKKEVSSDTHREEIQIETGWDFEGNHPFNQRRLWK